MTALMYPFADNRTAPVQRGNRRRSRWILRLVAALILEVMRQAFGEAGGR